MGSEMCIRDRATLDKSLGVFLLSTIRAISNPDWPNTKDVIINILNNIVMPTIPYLLIDFSLIQLMRLKL